MYTRKTVTESPAKKLNSDITFTSDKTHQIICVSWEHCNKENTVIKVTNSPFKINASSFDGMNYHNFEVTLSLTHDITTLKDTFYDFNEKGFRIHVPNENMAKPKVETVTLPLKT